MQTQSTNPLHSYFRQPKIYLKLPSKGKFYTPGSLNINENNEYPVMSMTARDELIIKTPDALLNGSSTVEMIQSCIPNITNAWNMPSLDLDACLIAIRIATFGEDLNLTVNIPNTDIKRDFSVKLPPLLDMLDAATFEDKLNYQGMLIHIRPLIYQQFTKTAIRNFEEQRIFSIVNDDSMDEQKKLDMFSRSFRKLTDITIDTVKASVQQIDVDDQSVNNSAHISEFIDNADKGFFKAITDHLEKQKNNFSLKPFTVSATDEEIKQGAPKKFDVPFTLDPSNFFGSES